MKVSDTLLEWARQQGWEPLPVGWNNYDEPINDELDIEVFIMEDGEPDYWYGAPIPGTQGYKFIRPEEMIEMFNTKQTKQ